MKFTRTDTVSCAKCQRLVSVARHHMGCEHMWTVHFKHQEGQKKYNDFYARYYEFRAEDICLLCKRCHKLIHRRYLLVIRKMIEDAEYKPLSEWTWEEAGFMMRVLRKYCEEWLNK